MKEMFFNRQTIDAQDFSQDVGEGALDAGHRVGARLLSDRTRCGFDVSPVSKSAFHGSSTQELGINEPITVSIPCWSARSLTSLLTARSSTPSPNGLNTGTLSEPFLARARPLRMSAKVHRMNFLCPTCCSARCTEVW